MNLDWNTFFSTMSQSAAGLIAIIAAFLISKLLNENEKQENLASQIDQLVIDFNDIAHRVSHRYFDWYDRINIEQSRKLEKAIKDGEFDILSEEDKLLKLFEIEPDLYQTEGCIDSLKKVINELKPINFGFGLQHTARIISSTNIWTQISEEREKINSLQVESYTLINKFQKIKQDCDIAKKSLNPVKYMIYILTIGFFLAVIYPLHFMPMQANEEPIISFKLKSFVNLVFSFKGGFIFILIAVVVAIFGYFLVFINQIENSYKSLENTLQSKYLNIKSYSKYFK